MRYFALATDYDGTLARDGVVSPATVEALERFCETGRKLLLVTGRELPDLMRVSPRLDLFDRVADDEQPVHLKPYGANLLLTGSSGSGKSTIATAILERLDEQQYQFCIIDPEGDYESLEGTLVLGDPDRSPSIDAVMELLEKSDQTAIVNLLGIGIAHRPAFFEKLLPRLQELRAQSGRPHWIGIDEAHHLLPTSWRPSSTTLPQELSGLMLITVHPNHVAPAVPLLIDTIVTVGEAPEQAIEAFSAALERSRDAGEPLPARFRASGSARIENGEALIWSRASGEPPFRLRLAPPRGERRRHLRKYAEGTLAEDKSFYFRGPAGKLNLRAQNLVLFNQIAEGVDDETCLYHLHQGDYSRWFREAIRDDELADEVARVEQQQIGPAESRTAIKAAIEERYTAPA